MIKIDNRVIKEKIKLISYFPEYILVVLFFVQYILSIPL